MADFKPIETQEALDTIIGERLSREREKYADYDALKQSVSDLQKTVGDLNTEKKDAQKTIDDLNGKVKRYETDSAKTRIALSAGLPFEMIDRLKGETDDEIKADAEALVKLMGAGRRQQPMRESESGSGSGAWSELSRALAERM